MDPMKPITKTRHISRKLLLRQWNDPDLPQHPLRSVLNNTIGYDVRRIKRNNKIVWSNPPSTKKHRVLSPRATYAPWLDDPHFLQIHSKIVDHTLVDIYRCYELWSLAEQASRIEGDILEVGVWRGGTGAILAEAMKNTNKTVYLADTFTGVVKGGRSDTKYKEGEHADTSYELVTELLASLSLQNVILLNGVFPDDTQHAISGNIALLHCDVDVYESTKHIIAWCLPRLSLGSILAVDDYGFDGCEGVTTYCDELRQNKEFSFVYNLNGHAIFIKTR